MTRQERLTLIAGLLIMAAVVTAAIVWGRVLDGEPWFGAESNLIELVTGPGALLAIATFLAARWVNRCGMPHCARLGQHPVQGTIYRVCHQHHTRANHRTVLAIHRDRHGPHALGWGDSHNEGGST